MSRNLTEGADIVLVIQSIEEALRKDTDRFFLKNMDYGRHLFISELDTERS